MKELGEKQLRWIEMKYFGEVFAAEGGGITSVVLNDDEEKEYVTCSVGLVDAS